MPDDFSSPAKESDSLQKALVHYQDEMKKLTSEYDEKIKNILKGLDEKKINEVRKKLGI